MANIYIIIIILITLLALSIYLIIILLRKKSTLSRENSTLKHMKISQSVKYGKFSEQFFPFLDKYPYDSTRFRFLGSPVDGVQFDDDKIVFVEFKVNKSGLTEKQKNIKELVKNKKVDFEEFKIK